MDLTKQEIIEAIQQSLKDHVILDAETHREHHSYIAYLIERDEARKRRMERVKTTVIGGLILGAISGIGSFLYWVGSLAIDGWRRMHG